MFQVPLAGQSINTAQIGIETNISSSSATIGNASITNATIGQLSTTIFNPASVTTTTLDANIGNIGTLVVTNPVANLPVSVLNCSIINASVKNVCNISAIHISASQITCDNLQPLLTAGTNISIVDGVISAGNDALLPSIANFSTINSHIINSSFFVSNLANMFHTSTVSISSNHASFVALTANNLSTGDLNFGSNLSYNPFTKHLDVNTAQFVTENDARPVTSWAVYKEFVNRLSEQVNNIMTVHFYKLSDSEVTLVATQVPAGGNNTIFRVDFTPQYLNSKIAIEICYGYSVGGNGTDQIITDLMVGTNDNQSQLLIQRLIQKWNDNNGGGTRSGASGSIMGVYDNADTLGKFHRVYLKIDNTSNDLWELSNITLPAIKITEILEIETINNPNIRIGSGNISCGNISASNISCAQITVSQFIVDGDVTTNEGFNAGGGFITTGFKPDGTIAALSRIRMAGGASLFNSADAQWDGTTFNISMRQANKNFKVSISGQEYLQVNVSNTSTRSLIVNGNLSVTGAFGIDSLVLNSLVLNGLSTFQSARFNNNVSILGHLNSCNVSIHGNVSIVGFATISGNLSMLGNISARHISAPNLSTASLVAGQNISILNGSIAAFITGGNDIDIRNLHVDEDVNIVGLLHVSETSTFKQSLNVCNIIYAGDAGEQDGSVVVYSQQIGNNWATKFDDDKLNMSATGTAQEANIWVGGNKTLSVTATGVNISGLITANQFNFSLDNVSFTNFSSVNSTATNGSFTNLSCVNITANSIVAPNVQPTLTAGVGINISGNVISGTETLVAGQNISIFNNIVSTTPNINVSNLSVINGSFTTLSCSGNISFPIGFALYRDFTGLLNVCDIQIKGLFGSTFSTTTGNFSKINVSNISLTGIGPKLSMGGLGEIFGVGTYTGIQANLSKVNASNISTINLSATNITATSISAPNLSTASLGLSNDLYILNNVLEVDFTSANDAATAEVNSLASSLASNVSTTSVSAVFGTIGLLTINTLANAPTINVSTLNASTISASSIIAPNVQPTLTAGSGINISGTTISTTQTLVAGNNIQIVGNDISTTTTINSSVHTATTMNTSILNASDIDAPMGEIDNLSSINFSATTGTITTLTSTTQNATTTNTSTLNASSVATNSFSVVNAFSAGQINSGLINASTLNSSTATSLTYNAGTMNASGVNGSSIKGNNISVLGTGTLDSFLIRSTTTNAATLNCSDINVSNKVSCVNLSLTNMSATLITPTTIRATTSNGTTMNCSNINISTKIHGTNLSITNISATLITTGTIRATTSEGTTMNASNVNISTKLTTTNISATNISASSITAPNVQQTLVAGSGINISGTTISTTQTLVAGNNIQIIGNDISTTTTINSSVHNAETMNASNINISTKLTTTNISATNITANSITAPNVQETLIAGSGINISGTTISTTQTLTAGNNIQIIGNDILTTTTINSSVHNAETMNTSIINASDIDAPMGEIDNLSSINISATTGTITTLTSTTQNTTTTNTSTLNASSVATNSFSVVNAFSAGQINSGLINVSTLNSSTATSLTYNAGTINGSGVNGSSIKGNNISVLGTGTLDSFLIRSTTTNAATLNCSDINVSNKVSCVNLSLTNMSATLITPTTIRATTSNGTTMNCSNINISTKITAVNLSITNISATEITATTIRATTSNGTTINASNINISTKLTVPNISSARANFTTDIITPKVTAEALNTSSSLNFNISNVPQMELGSALFMYTDIQGTNGYFTGNLSAINGSFTTLSASSITAPNVQPTLIAGSGINIAGTTISTTQTLVAGNNIQIIGNDILTTTTINSSVHNAETMNTSIINASDIDSILGEIDNLSSINFSATNITATSITAPNVQPLLTAGANINISNNVISSTATLTAGNNISILNGIVSLNPNINISNISVINGSFSALTCTGNISFPIGFALYRDFTGLMNVCDIQIRGLFGSTFSTTTGNFSKINVSNVSFTGLAPKMSMGGLGDIFGVGTYTGLNANVSQVNASNISTINLSATNITATSIVAPNVQPLLTAGNNIQLVGNTISTTTTINSSVQNAQTINTSNINVSLKVHTTNLSTTNFSGGLGTFSGNLTLDGLLTLNQQPRFLARYQGATSPLPIGTNVVLEYNTIVYEVGGGYSTTTFNYTVPVAGIYFFMCSYNTDGTTPTEVYIEKNGLSLQRTRKTGTTNADSTLYVTVISQCVAGNTIRCINRQNSVRLQALGTLPQGLHQFSGTRIG